jgi:kynurenine formamidase
MTRGPAWKWHNISMNEHTGTHFDAPIHWVSGRDVPTARWTRSRRAPSSVRSA